MSGEGGCVQVHSDRLVPKTNHHHIIFGWGMAGHTGNDGVRYPHNRVVLKRRGDVSKALQPYVKHLAAPFDETVGVHNHQ